MISKNKSSEESERAMKSALSQQTKNRQDSITNINMNKK